MATSKTMRQLDLEILKADIDWLRAYADLAVKHPSVSERALKARKTKISAIFEQLEQFDSCVHEGEDALPID